MSIAILIVKCVRCNHKFENSREANLLPWTRLKGHGRAIMRKADIDNDNNR